MRTYSISPRDVPDAARRLAAVLTAYQDRTGRPAAVVHVPAGEGGLAVPGVRVVEAPRTWPLRPGCYRVGQEGEG
jgi:hypothetical protein